MRLIYLAACVVLGVAVATYSFATTGHAAASSVFLGLAATVLGLICWVLLRAARALVEEPAPIEVARVTGRRRKELEREKQSLLKALKELEFDHEMGKVSDPDFREIGGQYRARAMRVLRQLDEAGADYGTLVERELKARLAAGQKDSQKEAAPKPRPQPERNQCADCGTDNDVDAVFCKKCGKRFSPDDLEVRT
jgi:hypothetical protein